MASAFDYYATLQVADDADPASLRRAYRAQMRRYHPDVTSEEDAEDRCRAVNEAYACLRDPYQRAVYDARRRAASRAAGFQPWPSPRSYHPQWGARDIAGLDGDDGPDSRMRKVLAVATALVVTYLTFTLTAAVRVDTTPPSTTGKGTSP